MLEKLKGLTKQTIVYGFGNVLVRMLTFILLPFYMHVLPKAEYGVAILVMTFIAFMNHIYRYGMDSAILKFYEGADDDRERRSILSSGFYLNLITSVILSSALLFFKDQIGNLLIAANTGNYIRFAAFIMFFDCMSWIPMALLRLKEKPRLFLAIRLVEVALNLGLNIYFVVILRIGIRGIFISTLLSAFTKFLLLSLTIIKELRLTFSWQKARELVLFGLPLMPTGLILSAMQLINRRFVIEKYLGTDDVGLYGAGYKLGKFMMLVSVAFYYAWQPFFLKSGVSEDSKKLFSRVLTYFTFVGLYIWLGLTLFIEHIANIHIEDKYLINPDYQSCIRIVPYLLLAFVFYGIYQIFLPGIYHKKKTKYIAYNMIFTGIVNVGLNFLLVPRIGILGAAFGTLAGFIVLAILTYYKSQQLIKVDYEYFRIALLLILIVPVGLVLFYIQISVFVRIAIFVALPFLLYVFRFFDSQEIAFLKNLIKKRQELSS
ncbi:MAG TPA: oligosaccharide flippase family protein [bacterium]|nr:oligosaccharide flippase family protein [bacterium]